MDRERTRRFVERLWSESVIPTLVNYIRIPNKSPAFDPAWQTNGHMDTAVALIEQWCRQQALAHMSLEVVRLEGRTPVLLLEIPGEGRDGVLLYGHLDKQPEMSGWRKGLGPWSPVLQGDRLYGRGAGDDGYAVFAALSAIGALQDQAIPCPRCTILIESCEESGSYDLPYYMDQLSHRMGTPSLVICLDSGCGNYDQLWCTTSLRGMAAGVLSIDVLHEGVHSGDASGIVPSPFCVLRQLLSRLEDQRDGMILPPELHVAIPAERVDQARRAATVLADGVFQKYPFLPGVRPVDGAPEELVLNRTWRPALTITGLAGLPPLADAGNVTVPRIAAKLSLRLAPKCDAEQATHYLQQLLENLPPYGVQVRFVPDPSADGWDAPPLAPWLASATERASRAFFGKEAVYMGEGGTIPFMAMLGKRFPASQFLVTGVLGPESNAHGPNEFLHLPTAKNLTCCVAEILAAYGGSTTS
ncbi:MAG: M20/M25/M40 family metallo-hydrolase [Gammaproteobacteria bacterium]